MCKFELVYLDTCLPDYFQGFAGQTYAVSLSPKPRKSEVLEGLHGAIEDIELFISGDSVDSDVYHSLHEQAEKLFRDEDKRTRWSKLCDDLSESYAYFGVKVTEAEEQCE